MSTTAGGRPLRVAVVGAGIGVRYAEAFQRLHDVQVVAICASGRERAAPAAARLGIPAVQTDFAEMLERDEPDIVAVATPNDLHHAMTLASLRAGAHVLCDKPLAMNVAQAREMLSEAEALGRRHIVPFWWRFLPVMQAARAVIGDGSLGEPFFAEVRYLNCGWGDPHGPMRWQFDTVRAGSGVLGNVGSHALHVLQWLVGDLVEISARTAINVPERRWPDGTLARPDGEDSVGIVGTLANGAPVTFLASSTAHAVRSSFGVTAHYSHGSVTVIAESDWPSGVRGRLHVMRGGESAPTEVPVETPPGDLDLTAQDASYVAIAREFVAAIREERPAAPGFDDGLRVQQVIEAALESDRTRSWVNVGQTSKVSVAL